MNADFQIAGGGAVYLLIPLTDEAVDWCDEHLPEDRQTLGRGIAVEHRYIGDILEGIVADGLVVT